MILIIIQFFITISYYLLIDITRYSSFSALCALHELEHHKGSLDRADWNEGLFWIWGWTKYLSFTLSLCCCYCCINNQQTRTIKYTVIYRLLTFYLKGIGRSTTEYSKPSNKKGKERITYVQNMLMEKKGFVSWYMQKCTKYFTVSNLPYFFLSLLNLVNRHIH